MKKFLLVILAICTLGLFMGNVSAEEELPEVTNHEKVKIYLFRSNGCTFCKSFIEYFHGLGDKYNDYFEVVSYEVGSNAKNSSLKSYVDEEIGNDSSGVPLIVIDDWFKLGFGETTGEAIIEKALDSYEDKKYEDVVAKIIAKEELETSAQTLAEAYDEEFNEVSTGTVTEPVEENTNGTIIWILFGVIIVGFGALMFVSRKKA